MTQTDISWDYPFLRSGGEMGALIRSIDWRSNPLGEPGGWPSALRTTLSNLLHSRFPMFLWWGEEKIQFYNDAYQPTFGAVGKHPKAMGQRGEECWPETWATIYPLMQQVRATGEATWLEDQLIPIHRNDSLEDVYWTFSFSLVLNDDGGFGGIQVICMETTEAVLARKRMKASEAQYRQLSVQLDEQVQQRTQELTTANQELLTSNTELGEVNSLLVRSNINLQTFAYIASHDLQEPLRKIQQFSDMLKTRYADSDEERLDYLSRIQLAANRMSTLIRDLLSFSRISTQRDTSSLLSLDSVLAQVLNTLELVIQETNARLIIDPLPTIMGDELQLGQLFQNLLSNALKFSCIDEHGATKIPVITIQAQLVSAAELPDTVKPARRTSRYHRLTVADNGVGFDERYLDRIFQVFQRLHGKAQFAGTGIGLAICEKVVTNHGGAITAISRPNEGATFVVYLPE